MREQECPVCNRTIRPKDLDEFVKHVKRCGRENKVIETESESNSKMGNIRATYKGEKFDSKLEAEFCAYLDDEVRGEFVKYYLRQVPFHLPGNTRYRVDFMIVFPDDRIEFVDTKGFETKSFKKNKKQVEALYPVKIIIKKKEDF